MKTKNTKKSIDIVIPIYNEHESLPELLSRLRHLKKQLFNYQLHLIFVDDGSSDDSNSILSCSLDKDDQLITLSRNYGHQIAITAGLDHSQADITVVIDADLQDPPETITQMIKVWENGAQVVSAQRKSRKDSLFKKVTAWLFYRVLSNLSSVSIPLDTGDFRLMDKQVVSALKAFREKNRFMRGIIASMGFKQTSVLIDRDERRYGRTKYPLNKMINFAIDGVLSFSVIPLKVLTMVGFITVIISSFGIIYAIYMKFFHPEVTVSGWTLIMIVIFFMGSMQMIMLGVIGEYIGRIYTEVQNRPLYIIDPKNSKYYPK